MSLRSATLRIAAELPVGDPTRRKLLSVLVPEASDKTAAGSGAANAKYLEGLDPRMRAKILKAVAAHYGVSVSEIEDELKDRDAEDLYEYLAFDRGMAMQVYRDFKRMHLASDKTAAKWIQDAIKEPGRVRKYLGIPKGKDIPMAKLDAAIEKEKGEGGDKSLLSALLLAKRLKTEF